MRTTCDRNLIRCDLQPAGYAELVINRPAARNALCRSLTDAMAAQLLELAASSPRPATPPGQEEGFELAVKAEKFSAARWW